MSKENVDLFKVKYGNEHNIDDALKSYDSDIQHTALRNKNIQPRHIDFAFQQPELRNFAIKKSKLPDHVIDGILDDDYKPDLFRLSTNPYIKSHHIHRLLDSNIFSSAQDFVDNKNFDSTHIQRIIDNKDYKYTPYTQSVAAYSHKITHDQITQILTPENVFNHIVKLAALRNIHAQPFHKEMAKTDKDYRVREEAGALE